MQQRSVTKSGIRSSLRVTWRPWAVGLFWLTLLVLGSSLAQASASGSRENDAIPDAIVYGDGQEPVCRHAAQELARYLHKITGRRVRVSGDRRELPAAWKRVMLVGDAGHNRATGKLEAARRFRLPVLRGDGFGLKSASDGKRDYLVFFGGDGSGFLPGGNGRGTLYAVYDYLEQECGAGFFEDGERVPRMAAVPFGGIDRSEIPRFELRGRNCFFHGGLAKYRANFWGVPEWRRNIDWRLKRKMNIIWGRPLAFFLHDPEKRNMFHHQWKGVLDYARERGMKVQYSLDYGQVPEEFIRENADRKFIKSEVYGLIGLHPDDPLAALYTKQRLEAVIREYGTDHLYFCAPYGDLRPDEAPLEVRIRAARQFIQVLKAVDPQAVWVTDTWDYLSNSALWTKENVKTYLNESPTDLLVIENGADSIDLRHEHEFFHGKSWVFTVLHSLGGDDELHGDPADLIRRVQEVVSNPKGANCKGIALTPEICGTNIVYFDLASRLAWRPDDITVEKFLDGYVARRYGRESASNMLDSMAKLLKAVYTGNGFFSENGIATVHQN